MTFPREYPLGVPVNQVISSTNFTNWDVRISQSLDGVGGGTYGGALILTNTSLTTTSSVNTGGDVTAHNLHATNTLTVDGTSSFGGTGNFTGDLGVSGTLSCVNVAATQRIAATLTMSAAVMLADKAQPNSVNEQTIDCAGGGVTVTLDLTLHDNFLIHLQDSAAATNVAVLHAAIFAFASANPDAAVKKGSKYRVVFDAVSTQTGGMGLDFGFWPATVRGYIKSDCLGPRSGDITGVGGGGDFMIWELEYTGIAGTPYTATLIEIGGGL